MKRSRMPIENENYSSLEEYLQLMLPIVSPREDFVNSLRQRLRDMPAQKHWLPTVMFFFLITLAGLVSGLILVATSLRALLTIAAGVGLVYKMRSSPKTGSSPSAQPGG